MNTSSAIIESGTSNDPEAIIAMLKELLEIGIPIEQLQRCDKLDLEFEYIQMHSKDSLVESTRSGPAVNEITDN
jgi:hypothetical protein